MNWSLEKYTGMKSRHTCPACERKRSFTLYVNEDGEPLNPAVGRCDHESACGYHYTPARPILLRSLQLLRRARPCPRRPTGGYRRR